MMGHKICFNGKIWKIIPKFFPLPLLIWSTADKKLNVLAVAFFVVIDESYPGFIIKYLQYVAGAIGKMFSMLL